MAERQIANELRLTHKQTVLAIVLTGIVVFAIVSYFGWTKVYENPARVFWDGIANDLATSQVIRQINEQSTGTTLSETIRLNLSGGDLAQANTTLTNLGSSISTETIGTPYADYVKYTDIIDKAHNQKVIPLSLRSLIGVWVKHSPGTLKSPLTHLLGQSILGVVPTAYIPEPQRQALMVLAHKAFKPDLSTVSTRTINGKRAYVYRVKISAVNYAEFVSTFCSDEGFGRPAFLRPGNFSAGSTYDLQFSINPQSHEILQINYGHGHVENYSGYGVPTSITIPTHTSK